MSVALRYAGQSAQCKDIVQESMIRVFKHLKSFRGEDESSFKAWVRKITAREAIRWLKKQNKHNSLEPADIQCTLEGSDIEDTLLQDELMQYLHQLPDGYRTVFNMYAIEGYSHKEIGKILEISASSSRSQLSRARAQLQEIIKEKNSYAKVQ